MPNAVKASPAVLRSLHASPGELTLLSLREGAPAGPSGKLQRSEVSMTHSAVTAISQLLGPVDNSTAVAQVPGSVSSSSSSSSSSSASSSSSSSGSALGTETMKHLYSDRPGKRKVKRKIYSEEEKESEKEEQVNDIAPATAVCIPEVASGPEAARTFCERAVFEGCTETEARAAIAALAGEEARPLRTWMFGTFAAPMARMLQSARDRNRGSSGDAESSGFTTTAAAATSQQ